MDVWDAETGDKLATLVNLDVVSAFSQTPEWLVVTGLDGLFDGSPDAWPQIMWRFSKNTFYVGPVEIFFNEAGTTGVSRPRSSRAVGRMRPASCGRSIVVNRRSP